MIEKNLKKITFQDKRAIQLFEDIGLKKNIAKTLIYISKNGGCHSGEIEQETQQRQPEVSAAMQDLLRKGWIIKRDFRKKRKGRPIQIYKLAYPLEDILLLIEKEKNLEIENLKKNILFLKSLIEKNINNN
jgi:predicted transcriptional regulator